MFNIAEANKIIAKFMGHYINDNKFENDEVIIDGVIWDGDIKYNQEWNWLMPVINRIKSVTEEPFDLDFLKESLWFDTLEEVHTQVYHAITDINNGDIKVVEGE